MEVCQVEKVKDTDKYYLGLDMGTNSVGWAVTDDQYKLKKFRGNLMWGVHLFDEAHHADERRIFRTNRRRYDRRQQRIKLLQDFFAPEILKKDEFFFMRLKESALFPEDSKARSSSIYFDDPDYSDKDYYKEFPTIHHLIMELIENKEPHDIRHVYLACAYLLAHRGHFLSEIDVNNVDKIKDFKVNYDNFMRALEELCPELPFEISSDKLESIMKINGNITEKKKLFWDLLFKGKAPKDNDDNTINYEKLFALISGGTIELSKLFKKDEYENLEKNKITISSADLAETLDEIEPNISSEEFELLRSVQAVYEWSLLVDSLKDSDYISQAKVKDYNEHKKDLEALKSIVRNYCKTEYDEIFRMAINKPNYVSYSYNTNDLSPEKIDKNFKKCSSQEEFCKYIKSKIDKLKVREEDKEKYDKLIEKCVNGTLCPKQVTINNRVIPYQLNYIELEKILENASLYFDFLNEKDEYGKVMDKILKIMRFRIPYYVGPLVKRKDGDNCWVVRNEGEIYPWNFDEIIDHEKTENEFIRKMTCKCTYIAGEDVLPKYSLLYSKFNVLNEINKIAVCGRPITVQAKQRLYDNLFVNSKRRVTKKRIAEYLISIGEMSKDQNDGDISGVDTIVKSSLKSFHDFKNLLDNRILSECDVEDIIEHLTVTTDTRRLKTWLNKNYKLSDEDIKYISKLTYKDYGRLSRRLLENTFEIDVNTGVMLNEENIISRMWRENVNLMELLGRDYGYSAHINAVNAEHFSIKPVSLEQRMKDMYLSPAVRRSIIRTLDIAKEIRKIQGCDPKKIFIEMPREQNDNSKKGKRTDDRKKQITDFYKSIRKEYDVSELEKQLEGVDIGKLRSEKYFLYFMQLGKCMYTGKSIEFDQIGNDSIWNIDHIYPQAKVKDNSLDNKVLVDSNENGKKGDTYPINGTIRERMHDTWAWMFRAGLISQKKYSRLVRYERFSDKELAGFISRQLVETRQSTKAAAKILQEVFPKSKLVYVKAGIVSDFRNETKMYKCREINDLHHAKDAYLNIVLGNVYNAYFTENPLNFVKEHKDYSLKIFEKDSTNKTKGLLKRRLKQNDRVIWEPKESLDVVFNMMSKNSIRYVKYAYKRKGGFFNQQPERAKEGLIPRKTSGANQPLLDTSKYGGYNNSTASCFSIIKVNGDVIIVPVDLLFLESFLTNVTFAQEKAYDFLERYYNKRKLINIKPSDISFPIGLRPLKINTLLDIDGLRMNICSKNEQYISIALATSLLIDKNLNSYIKKIESFYRHYKENKDAPLTQGINKTDNLTVYKEISSKCSSKPFNIWPKFFESGSILKKGEDLFKRLSLLEQCLTLINILKILKTGRSTTCDLKAIGGVEKFHTERLKSVLTDSKFNSIRIIDQSPTGLFEKRSENLLRI